MSNSDTLEQLQGVLAELRTLLQAEGVQGFGYLLRHSTELARAASSDPEAAGALKDYLSRIPNVPGSFHDLVLWRDSFEERKVINEKLEMLRERLFTLARSL